jgi:ABC-type nitrate/sulfonate/bicarbonate transport system substrate-binding protein
VTTRAPELAALACLFALSGCGGKSTSWEASAPTVSEPDAIKYVSKNFDYRHYYTNDFVRAASTPPARPLTPTRKLRLGLYWVANDQIAPWFVGIAKGYFRDVGIDLDIVEGGPQRDNLSNLVGGNVDIYAGFAESIYQEIASRTGADLVMISANLKGTGNAWIMLDHSIPQGERSTHRVTVDDLRGHRIGIPTGAEYWVAFVREHYKLAPEDMVLVNVGTTPDALIAGTVDFYQGWYDDQPRLLDREGYHNYVVLRFDDLGYRSYSYISTVTRPFFTANPDVLRAYVYALNKSLRYLIAHTDEASEIVSKDCKAYEVTPAQVKWRIEQDMPLFVGNGTEPLLEFDDNHMLLTVAQLYRYHQIELPGAP